MCAASVNAPNIVLTSKVIYLQYNNKAWLPRKRHTLSLYERRFFTNPRIIVSGVLSLSQKGEHYR